MKKITLMLLLAAVLMGSTVPAFADDLPEQSATMAQSEDTDDENNAEDENNADDESNADDENNEETEPPAGEEIPVPAALSGLHSTSVSRTKVLLEWDESSDADTYQLYRKTAGGKYKLLATTEKTSYTDKGVQWGVTSSYKVVPVNEAGEAGTAGTLTCKPRTVVQPTSAKYTYAQMKKDMAALAALYSDYCTMSSIGTSVKGRQIYDLAIGNPSAKKSVLVVCTLHAREYICSAMAMEQAEYYLQNYNGKLDGTKPADILSDVQIHYIMMANPDGVTISQTKSKRWKANGRGVDLNRNFPASPFTVSGKKGSEGYTGKYALSEPESKALAAFTKQLIKKQNLAGVINYHAMGQIIYGDCSSKKVAADTQTMYSIAKSLTGYNYAGDSTSSKSVGFYREYVMYQLGVPSITIEIGSTTAPCAFRDYASAFNKNKNVVFAIARALE